MTIKRIINYVGRRSHNFYNVVDLCFSDCHHKEVAIITAFDSSHFKSGIQLIASLVENTTSRDIFVFNLGLNGEQLKKIKADFPSIEVCEFKFDGYPPFFDIKRNAGQYAWKATIISSFLDKDYEHLIWLDAGDKLIGDICNIQKLIEKFGFFAVPTSNSILELTHKDSILRLGVEIEKCDQLQLSAAFIGFCLKEKQVHKLIKDWAFYSGLEDVISPSGSDRSNHRQDQSLFNLLVVHNPTLRDISKKILARRYSINLLKVLTHQDVD